MRADMVRAYVESLLEKLTGNEKMVPDQDGDYQVRYNDALYYVRLIGDDPVVQVFSVALAEVPKSPELLEALNELNTRVRFARLMWISEQVLVETDLIGETIEPRSFHNACAAVATITDNVSKQLATKFGGKTAFADELAEDATLPAAPTGLYL